MAKISGTVTLGVAETPGEATVLALDETCENVVASVQSNASTGAYLIDTLDDATSYYLMVSGGGVYRSMIYGPCIAAANDNTYLVNYVSLLHFDGADGSASFVDQSGKVWTANGNAQIDVTQSKFGGAAGLFDGADDFISTPTTADFGFGTGDFTVEAWVYRNGSDVAIWDSRTVGGEPMVGYVSAAGKISFYDGTAKEGSLVVPVGAWSHVAWCRSAGVLRMFVDGVVAYSAVYTSNMGATRPMRIGCDVAGGADYNGWIDEFRVVKGRALYAEGFTPQTEAYPNGRVISQLHFDGPDGSGPVTDMSGRVWTAFGNAQIDTAESKFGGASYLLDGSGDYLQTAYTSDFEWGTVPFTIEGFIRPVLGADRNIMSQRNTATSGWALEVRSTGAVWLRAKIGATYSDTRITTAAGAVTAGVWSHVALCRDGSDWRIFVNGVLSGTLTDAGALNTDGGAPIRMGRSWGGAENEYSGHYDEFRIVRGVALYSADFTPPSAPFADPAVSSDSDIASVVSLMHFDGVDGSTSITDEKGVVWTVNGNAQIDTAQAKFGGSSLQLDGNGDYLSCAASADFGFGTGDFTVEGWFYRAGNNTNAFLADFRVVAGNSFVIWCSQTSTANALGYSDENGVTFIKGVAGELALNNWTHWAITRASGTVRGFVNGVLRFTGADARDFGASQGVRLGSSSAASQGAIGNLDDVRITKGVARYLSDFAPPTQPFPNP